MKEKIVTYVVLITMFLGMIGVVPQFVYNKYYKETSTSDVIYVDWEAKYPFDDVTVDELYENENDNDVISKYKNLVGKVKVKVENVINNNFPFRMNVIEQNARVLKLLGIKIISGSDDVVDIGDGYLTFIDVPIDVKHSAAALSEFENWLAENDIEFLYVQAPSKVAEGITEVSGYQDYSNANVDTMLDALDEDINVLDLRKCIADEFDVYKELFYKTDHHWLPDTGLWATQKISEKLNAEYAYEINTDLYDKDSYKVDTYESWLLGSLGKKVSLGYTGAEDFDVMYPLYDTNLRVNVPSLNIETEGDFYDTLIYKRVLKEKNYYDWDVYWAYGYGDKALIEVDNLNIEDGQRVLMIKDSFADTVYPFLSLGVNEMMVIDTRYFTGSLKTYIEQNKPDTVIMLCSPGTIVDGEIDFSSHTELFDFR